MEAYTAFAKVYDRLMRDVPYQKWGDAIDTWIKKYGISKPERDSKDALESERNLVLDLGCGTGVLTRIMYDKGYDMIGVDISEEMLEIAISECDRHECRQILYLCQDMCELDLYSTVGTVFSTCDSINYLLEDEEIMQCFKGVEKFLYPGGLFIFDFNTVYKYRDIIGDRTIAEEDDECSFIWDNYFDEADNINEYDLTLFIKQNSDGISDDANLYRKEQETHYQRGYTIEEIRNFLARAGLTIVAEYDERDVCDGGKYGISDDSERIIIISRKEAEKNGEL